MHPSTHSSTYPYHKIHNLWELQKILVQKRVKLRPVTLKPIKSMIMKTSRWIINELWSIFLKYHFKPNISSGHSTNYILGSLHKRDWQPMTGSRSCFMVTWIIFKIHFLDEGQTQNWETMTLRTLTTVGLFYFITCEDLHEHNFIEIVLG